MTDAAVGADSAPAPDAGGAVINENAPAFNSPLGSQIPPDARAENQPPAKPASIDDSIDRAMAKVEAKQAAPKEAKVEPKTDAKPEAKVEAKEPPVRGEGGKFAAKDVPPVAAKAEPVKPSFTASDAPSRFSEDAKKDWATAPESVRRESERAIKELTEGFQKYKAGHEQNEGLREFHEMAKASGKELNGVVREYVNMESLLRSNPEAGLEKILERVGLTPRQYAEHILNRTPEQHSSQQDSTIRELRQQNSTLEARLNKLEGGFNEQRQQSTLTEVNQFAAAHPRFEELADAISEELKHGYSLSDAYSRAERLNPAPASQAKEEPEEPAASSAAAEPPVHPDKGQKSITGAPSSGSTPAAKKRVAKSLDDALDTAFGRTG
jgi:hypothetical protein